MNSIESVVLLGSGNVAAHLGRALLISGVQVLQVYSRSLDSANRLANELSCKAADNYDQLIPHAGLYVLAVSDDAIAGLAQSFPFKDKLLVHTSGSTGMEVLRAGSNYYGVLYPLQTFSGEVPADFSSVPLCLELSDPALKPQLQHLAGMLSDTVVWVSSEKRRQLHLAAVFACNFVNHMYAQAADILEDEKAFDLLRPLIKETARKALEADPRLVQTGPARRNNKVIMEKHADMLAGKEDLQRLYNFVSESIVSFYHKNKQ